MKITSSIALAVLLKSLGNLKRVPDGGVLLMLDDNGAGPPLK
jgi:hypothetical protein